MVCNSDLLLLDDDGKWGSVISRFLKTCGYKMISADTCASGIKAALEASPDCVLLDFNLPDKDGCEAAFHIRRDSAARKTPIIMVSK